MSPTFKLRNPPLEERPWAGDVESSSKNFLLIPVKLSHVSETLDLQALVDSGAEENLIDRSIVTRLSLPTEALSSPVKATGLGGQHLSVITHRTEPVLLVSSGSHRLPEETNRTGSVFRYPYPQNPFILGFSWLRRHNPQFDWVHHRVIGWSDFCLANCLQSAVPSVLKKSTCLTFLAAITISALFSVKPKPVLCLPTVPMTAPSLY